MRTESFRWTQSGRSSLHTLILQPYTSPFVSIRPDCQPAMWVIDSPQLPPPPTVSRTPSGKTPNPAIPSLGPLLGAGASPLQAGPLPPASLWGL